MGLFDRKPNIEELMEKGDIKGLTKALKYKDPATRMDAVEALGKKAEAIGEEAFTEALRSLGFLGDKLADYASERVWELLAPLILLVINDESEIVRKNTIETLIKVGKAALPSLIDLQGDESVDKEVRAKIPHAIAKITGRNAEREEFFEGLPPTGDGLCSDRDCPCPEVKIPRGTGYAYISEDLVKTRYNARSLYKLGQNTKKYLTVFGEQVGTVILPSSITSPLIMCELGAALRGIDLDVAASDAKLWWETNLAPLRPTPKSPEIEPLIRILIKAVREYSSPKVREKVIKALVKIGKPAVEPLLEVLNDSENIARQVATEVLEKIGDARAIEPLTVAALKDQNEGVQKATKQALGRIIDARAVKPLTQAMRDENGDIRETATEALEKIKPKKSPDLRNSLDKLRKTNFAKRVHVAPGIPEKQLRNATASMGVPAGSDVLLLVDDSLTKSGKAGICVTSDQICWKKLGTKGSVKFDDVKQFDAKLGFFITFKINGQEIPLDQFSKEEIRPFADFLLDIVTPKLKRARVTKKPIKPKIERNLDITELTAKKDEERKVVSAKIEQAVEKRGRCAQCGKHISEPGEVVPTVFSGSQLKEIADKMFSRPVYCKQCGVSYCEGCAFEAGRKVGKRRLICPRCHNDLGDASRL